MKIQNEQLIALQRQQEAKKKTPVGKQDAFTNLLNEKLGGQTAATSPGQVKIPLVNQLTPAGMLLQSSSSEGRLMERLDHLLGQWENYAGQLESPHNSLRDIYSSFQNLTQDLKAAKEDVPPETNSILRDVLNEIEVLAETEKIKINRGDYFL